LGTKLSQQLTKSHRKKETWKDPETDGTIIFESYKHHSSLAAHKLGLEEQNAESVCITKDECQ